MQLKPLYRLRFDYPQSWSVELTGEGGTEEQHFLYAEGRAEGRISGKFHATNFARRRTDKTYLTAIYGVIETDDGAAIMLEYRGFGRAYREPYKTQSPNRRQWVATATHVSQDPRYLWINDVVCVGTGEVRPKTEGRTDTNPSDLVLEVAELVWEPFVD
jgi:uncharacterized protein DUF3237